MVLLVGFPLTVWLDMRNLASTQLDQQARDLNSMITAIREFYANDVVARVLASHGHDVQVRHDYAAVPGAIPLPATLSLALGKVVSDRQSNIGYRFASDYPFKNRVAHPLDEFERKALDAMRLSSKLPQVRVVSSALTTEVRMISPVIMDSACVSCHNNHPESTKTDWQVGDVRGFQEVIVTRSIATEISSFRYILAYLALMALAGFVVIWSMHRDNRLIGSMNRDLKDANDFLAAISMKISRYLSPQVYRSIFSGEIQVEIKTERKLLTIFFSDIKGFTELTESLQPEAIAALINEYFSEMSDIVHKHGGTIDKFIGDAILVFFGDPISRGAAEDAAACVAMAMEMQGRLAALNSRWRKQGIEEPFRVRMGINTGYCNVGNFGSSERMDYTILGAEANLAARLQSIAEPGRIVMSYETYAYVADRVAARKLEPTHMKGIAREVIPYEIVGSLDGQGASSAIFDEHSQGIDIYMNLARIDSSALPHLRHVLQDAIVAIDKHNSGAENY